MLSVTGLTKRYGDETALAALSLSVDGGEFVTLLGPSGCGKTTTLLAIAGHVTPTAGTVSIGGRDVTDSPPEARSCGLVFQQDALFPHMTARENVAYALAPHDPDEQRQERRVDDLLSLVGMADHAGKHPEQLSGGQRRRVELVRALATDPDVLLLDEPLTGLDRALREDLRAEIARVHEETGVTTLYVTHDQTEALSLSDRLTILRDGRIVGSGKPQTLYEQPLCRFVASFLGPASELAASLVESNPPVASWCGHEFVLDAPAPPEEPITLFLRPEDATSSLEGKPVDRDVAVDVTVQSVSHRGPHSTLMVEAPDGTTLSLKAAGFPDLERGDNLTVGFDAGDLTAFAGDDLVSIGHVR
ncbi:ABC transporter ATP-binding protein [Halobacteriales archaeon SW_7_65_23]|nr:MAG: ABC transporter ATP-binding protein [Halobacteriales archaeon SW_7_65_23]